ncbi:hypothetical protein [Cryobacterium sp. PH31-L1]|uniref:hypothetical protein n=1 Tax=Cryobacterium sp. PH31-L1 TaxID=3046199 RepID=UPI0024BA78FC|nr:hypothetical protein [Cryobacterium sp. PH31-L1]MDJ0378783.1 hypothetical protein [Cryobacterium sp. PH31-L1]
MADLLRDELLALNDFAVALDLERAHIPFGDKAVAVGESGERSFGGGAVGDPIVERWLEGGEAATLYAGRKCGWPTRT